VAEVRVDGGWAVVDAWLGVVLADDDGGLLGVGDLRSHPDLLAVYRRVGAADPTYFERGTTFRAFPYGGIGSLLVRFLARLRRRVAETADVGQRPMPGRPTDAAVLRMDAARMAHLEDRYSDAVAGYRALLGADLPPDMREAVRFFLGLALLRSGSVAEGIIAFDEALDASPSGPWAPSIHYHRAELRSLAGDTAGAIEDLRAARTPAADRKLTELRQS
jgi:tetratricopeptide (TPR) repeat protein